MQTGPGCHSWQAIKACHPPGSGCSGNRPGVQLVTWHSHSPPAPGTHRPRLLDTEGVSSVPRARLQAPRGRRGNGWGRVGLRGGEPRVGGACPHSSSCAMPGHAGHPPGRGSHGQLPQTVWLLQPGVGCYWRLVWGPGCCSVPHRAQDRPPQRITWPQMPTVPREGSPDLGPTSRKML